MWVLNIAFYVMPLDWTSSPVYGWKRIHQYITQFAYLHYAILFAVSALILQIRTRDILVALKSAQGKSFVKFSFCIICNIRECTVHLRMFTTICISTRVHAICIIGSFKVAFATKRKRTPCIKKLLSPLLVLRTLFGFSGLRALW